MLGGVRIATVRLAAALAAAVAVVLLGVAGSASAAVPAWLTYDHDATRSATDPDSGSPVAPSPAWPGADTVDGSVYAQPLVYGSRVYVATENDTIYALDAATGAVAWSRNVGPAVPSGDLPCGDISPTVGITSTPVIDPFAGRIYAVADELINGSVHHQLVALALATGDPVAGFPVDVDPPGDDPTTLLNRASLALDAGHVIVPYGGNAGDCGEYHGWLVSAPTAGGPPTYFEVDPNPGDHGAAIWGGGDGPSQDGAGHLFATTGNGFSSASTPDLQESVVELDPSVNVLDHWTASNWQDLDNSDLDVSSSQPLPLPNGLLFQVGKDGVGRLLDAGALGTTGQVFSAQACTSGGGYGGSLYHDGVIYVPCTNGITALAVSLSPTPSFTALPGFTTPSGATGPPIFAGGVVWSTGWRSSQVLYGLDPASGAVSFQTSVGTFDHFATPSAGGGRLFVAASNEVSALTISHFPPGTTTSLTSSSDPSEAGSVVRLTATVTPAPDAGTVAFSEGGTALPGCGAVVPSPINGAAICSARLAGGTHEIVAAYSGDPYSGASTSSPLRQVVRSGPPEARPPRVSAVSLGAHRFTARKGVRLTLTLSEAARLQIVVTRLRTGRLVHHRCRLGPRHGRRCTVRHRARRLSVKGRAGRNRLHLKLRGLAIGRYTTAIVARNALGLKSPTVTVRFQIIAPQAKPRRHG
jgi:outer membrane protein assembly factor BamB